MNDMLASVQNLSPAQRKALHALMARKGIDLHARLPMPVVSREQPLPLSFAQQRLWFLWQLDPQGNAYNVPGAIRVSGPLDRPRLERAFEGLYQRHEALRTVFRHGDNGDTQVVLPAEPLAWTGYDLEHLPPELRLAQAHTLAEQEALAPFDLQQGPLLRLSLIRLASDDHVLLVTLHHIIADGWSVDILLRELARLYEQPDAALPDLPVQYPDYAQWQREWLAAGESDRQLAWWREQLGDSHPLLALPHDRPRPAVLSAQGGSHAWILSKADSERVKALARSEEVTPFVLLLAVFKVLLHRFSGETDLRVGVPYANRRRQEVEGVIGFFVNTLVLRTRLDSHGSFRHWLREVQATSMDAQAHQDLPFERLVEALKPERSLSHNPLFQVKFNYGFDTSVLPSPSGLVFTPMDNAYLGAHFDLALDIADSAEGFQCVFTFARDLFDGPTVEHFATAFNGVLEQVLTRPDQPVHALARDGQGTRLDGERVAFSHATVLEAWQARVARQPQALAAGDGQHSLGVAQLDGRANHLAAQLLAANPGAVIGLNLARGLDWLVGLLAVLKTGAACVPVDPEQPADYRVRLLRKAGVRLVVSGQALGDLQTLAPQAIEATLAPAVTVLPGQLAYVIHTSGSTGAPKGVAISHGALANYVQALLARLQLAPEASAAMVSSVAADLGHTALFGALCSDRTLYLPDADCVRDPDAFARFISQQRVGVLKIVPGHLAALLEAGPGVLPWHALVLGGEACPDGLLQRIRALSPDLRIINHYGPSETTVGVLTHESLAGDSHLPLGRPLANLQVRILDEHLQAVPPAVAGELYVGGAGLAQGYLGQPALTAERFVADPDGRGERLYRTGDRVRLGRDGQIEFLGRIDAQLKIRGYRVEPEEVAQVLRGLSGVKEAAVIFDEGLIAACVVTPSTQLSELQAALAMQLPDYLQPGRWLLLEALPRTANGKLDHKNLMALLQVGAQAGPVDEAVLELPASAEEATLAQIWCEVLKRDQVGVTENFFALGGDSILSLKIIARARKQGIKISPQQVFTHQTIRELVASLPVAKPAPVPLAENLAHDPALLQAPLSAGQQRLWFLWKLLPDSSAYHIQAAVRLQGNLDTVVLREAFERLTQRHASLRTAFIEESGEPRQQILEQRAPQWHEQDLRGAAQTWRSLVTAAGEQVFDLRSDSLLRVCLYRLEDTTWVVHLTLHHIVADGWSMDLLVNELVQHYRQVIGGDHTPPAPLALQYIDYARWQNERLGGAMGKTLLDSWCQRLRDIPRTLDLPLDFARPSTPVAQGSSLALRLPQPLCQALQALAQDHGTSLFSLLLSAFATLLQRHSGQSAFALGIPVANRERVEFEELIGFFVNTLALPIRLDPQASFSDTLRQLGGQLLDAQAQQALPFERLVEVLQPERSLSRTPLFQVMFSHTRLRSDALSELPGLTVHRLPMVSHSTQFELMLNSEELPGGELELTFHYANQLFAEVRIRRLAEAFERLLQGIVAAPGRALAHYEVLSTEQRQAALGLGQPQARHEVHECLHQAIARQAARRPQAIALWQWPQRADRLDYATLELRANRLAHRLRQLGAGPEICVGIAMTRGLDLLVAVLAVLKAGAAYLPIDPQAPAERRDWQLADSGAPLLLVDQPLSQGGAQVHLFAELEQSAHGASDQAPHTGVGPDNLAYVIYTSGSTGRPKGVQITHRHALRLLHSANAAGIGQGEDEVWTLFHSIAFDFSVWELFAPLVQGAQVVIVPLTVTRNPEAFLELLRDARVTVLNQTPSAFLALQQVVMAAKVRPGELALRQVVFGGEALEVASLRPWLQHFGAQAPELINMYGITETTVHVSYRRLALSDLTRVHSPIGQPLDDLDWYVLDDCLEPSPVGVEGELYVGGAGLARGYLGRPGLSAERFIAHPFNPQPGARLYRSGDRARRNEDGQLVYAGRGDQQVKLRGFRIETGEIEATLRTCPGIDGAVVRVSDSPSGPQLVAWLTGQPPEPGVLREHLAERLPDYMLPAFYVTLEHWPLTGNGKLDVKALPAPDWHGRQGYRAPHSALEQALAGIWCEVLGLGRVGLDDHFFELGGHSLLATQVVARVRERLQLELPLADVFAVPTLQALAERLASRVPLTPSAGRPTLQALQQTRYPLSPAQRRLWMVDRLGDSATRSAYNLCGRLAFDGPLDAALLQQALSAVVSRHDVLRSCYPVDSAGKPFAQILPPFCLALPVDDLAGLNAVEREHACAQASLEERQTHFDLQNGPLLRARLQCLGGDRHLLHLSLHHIVADGWSVGVLISDFCAAYSALLAGRSVTLPALSVQYGDYAVWQQRLWDEGYQQAELDYWCEALDGAPRSLELPGARPRPAVATASGKAHEFELDSALVTQVTALANAWQATSFMVLLASFQWWLHELTGSQDLLLGTDLAGREESALEALVGFFVNVVPVRSVRTPGMTFVELLQATRERSLQAFAHASVPFDRLVDAVGVPRDRSRNPLVQALFVMHNQPREDFQVPGLQIQMQESDQASSKFDMALFLQPRDAALAVRWVYADALFDVETIQTLARQWLMCLQRVLNAPHTVMEEPTMPQSSSSQAQPVEPVARSGGRRDRLKRFLETVDAPVPAVATDTLKIRPLRVGQRFVRVIEPHEPGLDPVAWAVAHRARIDALLVEHAGLLFRGFELHSSSDFEAFAEALHPGLYGAYGDLPKKEGGRNTYRSTPYPEQQMILFHNESAHTGRWPRKQWFFCELPSTVGGATPIVDCREMLEHLPADLVERFERRGLCYLRTFTRRLDVSWQDFYGTDQREEVERRCREAGIAWQWLSDDELQTRTPGPAVIRHPLSGARSFFNQVQLHHPSCLDAQVRRDLIAMVGIERLPRNVLYGDGEPIDDATMLRIGEVYEACAVRFDWLQGDVVMLDNMLAAHARDPYSGPRKIVVAMGELIDRTALEPGARP